MGGTEVKSIEPSSVDCATTCHPNLLFIVGERVSARSLSRMFFETTSAISSILCCSVIGQLLMRHLFVRLANWNVNVLSYHEFRQVI